MPLLCHLPTVEPLRVSVYSFINGAAGSVRHATEAGFQKTRVMTGSAVSKLWDWGVVLPKTTPKESGGPAAENLYIPISQEEKPYHPSESSHLTIPSEWIPSTTDYGSVFPLETPLESTVAEETTITNTESTVVTAAQPQSTLRPAAQSQSTPRPDTWLTTNLLTSPIDTWLTTNLLTSPIDTWLTTNLLTSPIDTWLTTNLLTSPIDALLTTSLLTSPIATQINSTTTDWWHPTTTTTTRPSSNCGGFLFSASGTFSSPVLPCILPQQC
ncbi:hypothetical protein H8959_011757 [Pygathrix nigripes]